MVNLQVIDLHQDLIMRIRSPLMFTDQPLRTEAELCAVYPQHYRLIFAAAFPGQSYDREVHQVSFLDPFREMINQLMAYQALANRYPKHLARITSYPDYLRARQANKTALLYHVEGLYGIASLADLQALYELGVRGVTMTWNTGNNLGSGCRDRRDYGLTSFGEEVVHFALDHHMLIDLAHLSPNTVRDVLAIADRSVLATHVGVGAVTKHPRNLPDETIRQIIDRKGIIGLVFFTPFLTTPQHPDASPAQLLDHLTYLIDHFGSDHFAFGTDYFGMQPHETIVPQHTDVDGVAEVLEFLAAQISSEELEKIAYRNAEAFLKRTLP